MLTFYPKPYDCEECHQYPDSAFHIYTPVNDWIIAFPEQRLFHVHFGEPTFPESQNTERAEDVAEYYYHRIHDYPDTMFFFIADMSKIDNSEMISDRAKQIYRTLLQHPQLITGAVYGATTDMQALLRLLSEEAEKSVSLVPSKAEADKVYQRWQAEQ